MEERRQHWPTNIDPQFWIDLHKHMTKEEEREKVTDLRMASIESDLRPLKKMYWAVVGSAGVGTLLLALLVYVYTDDRDSIKGMQTAIYEQGTAIKQLIVSHQELEKDIRRDMDRLEKDHAAIRAK